MGAGGRAGRQVDTALVRGGEAEGGGGDKRLPQLEMESVRGVLFYFGGGGLVLLC